MDGIFVIPSTNLSATPVFLTSDANAQERAFSFNVSLSGTKIIGDSPARMMYTATGTDGKVHMYSIDLTATSAAPVHVQASSLSLDSADQICDDGSSASDNELQPSTVWVLLHTNPVGTNCGISGDVYQIINYSDSPSTAPTIVSTISGSIDLNPMYHQNGALAGIALQQGTSLNFYPNKTFSTSSPLIQNITVSSFDLIDVTSNGQDNIGDSVSFYTVTDSTSTQLYRVTVGTTGNAATATSVYTSVASQPDSLDTADEPDSQFIYATDADSTAFRIQKVPINSGVAVHKYDADATVGNYVLIGSNDTALALYETPNTGPVTLQTVPVTGGQVFATTPIGTLAAGASITDSFLVEATPGTLSTAQILLNLTDLTSQSKSSEVIAMTGGAAIQPSLLNSTFFSFSQVFGNVVHQVRGITDTGLTALLGGGSINEYVVGTGAITPLTLPGGGAYAIPASSQAFVVSIASNASDVVGVGSVFGATPSGLATDNAVHLIVPITLTNTQITPL
jgi:hypothetical protein